MIQFFYVRNKNTSWRILFSGISCSLYILSGSYIFFMFSFQIKTIFDPQKNGGHEKVSAPAQDSAYEAQPLHSKSAAGINTCQERRVNPRSGDGGSINTLLGMVSTTGRCRGFKVPRASVRHSVGGMLGQMAQHPVNTGPESGVSCDPRVLVT